MQAVKKLDYTNDEWQLKQLESFINKGVPAIADNYEFGDDWVLVDILKFKRPKKDTGIIIPDTIAKSVLDDGEFNIPIARVCSNTGGYQKGDFIKLSDYKCAIIFNPKYEEWKKFPNKGNMERVGEEPPQVISQFYLVFDKFRFDPYPINQHNKTHNLNLYLIPKQEVICKIKNIEHVIYK